LGPGSEVCTLLRYLHRDETACVLTFRLPSYLLWHRLPRGKGGYHPLKYSIWFKISYRVI